MSAIIDKSYDFAIRIIELNRHLCEERKDFTLSRRLLTCGTGIGASVRQSASKGENDRQERLKDALNQAEETEYLLEIMVTTGYSSEKQSTPIRGDCKNLKEYIIKAMKENPKN